MLKSAYPNPIAFGIEYIAKFRRIFPETIGGSLDRRLLRTISCRMTGFITWTEKNWLSDFDRMLTNASRTVGRWHVGHRVAIGCFRTRMVDESWSAFRFLRKLGNGLNRDGRLYYRIGYGIRLGNVSSSPFRAIELREHRASSAPALRNLAGASAGKPSLPAFTSPPASNTRRFSASPVERRLRE